MTVRAKSKGSTYPIWIYGEYLTNPPSRPNGGGETRPKGHYIDSGGYPGANVYAVDMNTFCECVRVSDKQGKEIFDKDILLYETEKEIAYYAVLGEQAVDIVSGEILDLSGFNTEDIKIIGNMIDYPDFVEGIQHYAETGVPMPYIPSINVQRTSYPYMKLACEECGFITLSCTYMVRHKECGGFFLADFTTKIQRERKKALA